MAANTGNVTKLIGAKVRRSEKFNELLVILCLKEELTGSSFEDGEIEGKLFIEPRILDMANPRMVRG